VYRDDQCAVCGTSLPPDHVYCREHAVGVDDRLHQIGALLGRLLDDLPELTRLLDQVAPETWDWLSDTMGSDEDWPPPLGVQMRLHADQVDVDVDSEPGRVKVDLDAELLTWCDALRAALESKDLRAVADACARAQGAGAAY
jgi:hypothetical protein